MSSSFWLLTVESRDFSYTEKERIACKADQIHKVTTLLCEVTINSICKCFVVVFHPHMHIKSKTNAYNYRHMHIKSKTNTYNCRHLL